MEDLTKTQLVLLAVLISFVVSIATGIVTVTLLDQAPDQVPQTINRVISQTIEKVMPTETKTIIIKEEDLVVEVIKENLGTIAKTPETFGFVFKDGFIVTENKDFQSSEQIFSLGEKELSANLVVSDERGFTIFKTSLPQGTAFAKLGDAEKLKPGQTLVFIGPDFVDRRTFVAFDKDQLKVSQLVPAPALAFNLNGEAVGFSLKVGEETVILPINLIKEKLKS